MSSLRYLGTALCGWVVFLSLQGRAAETEAPAAQHQFIGVAASNPRAGIGTGHPEAQWFANAGLGLFVHFGLSSVDGRVDLSWGMMAETPWDKKGFKLTPEQYFGLAKRFDPQQFDPGKWLAAARKAGFRYAVMTTKHHDGYALWPSAFGEFNTRTHLQGRDLVRSYVEACRANDLKVGLYYSPPDWYYNRDRMSFRYKPSGATNFVPYGLKHQPVQLPEFSKEENQAWERDFRSYLRDQIEELLTRYGKIDLLWFDGGPEAISIARIRELQPGIVINPRMHGKADFSTAEVHFPERRPEGWWEMCSIWNSGGWGYTSREQYRSTASVLEEFSKVRAWGGNYLINVGPRSTGDLPEIAYDRLKQFGEWMRINGESVLDTQPGTWPEDCNVPYTIRANVRYFIVPTTPPQQVRFKTSKPPISVQKLGDVSKVGFTFAEQSGELLLPTGALSKQDLPCVIKAVFDE